MSWCVKFGGDEIWRDEVWVATTVRGPVFLSLSFVE